MHGIGLCCSYNVLNGNNSLYYSCHATEVYKMHSQRRGILPTEPAWGWAIAQW